MSRLSAMLLLCHGWINDRKDEEKKMNLPDHCLQNRNSFDTWRIPLWPLQFGPNLNRMNEFYCRYTRPIHVDIENQHRYHAWATILRGQTFILFKMKKFKTFFKYLRDESGFASNYFNISQLKTMNKIAHLWFTKWDKFQIDKLFKMTIVWFQLIFYKSNTVRTQWFIINCYMHL